MFRTDLFRESLFTARQQPYVDFDPAFYERLKSTGLQAKLCWDAECRHLENDANTIMVWDHWPESWETTDIPAYRTGVLTGRAACQWIVDTLNGPEPAAIWGLSDGDVAWWCLDALARLPDVDHEWLDRLALTTGLHPEDREELWPLFDEACRNAPHWLAQHGWDIAERLTHAALTAHGVTIDAEGFGYARNRKRKVDCNAVYKLLDEGFGWPLLDGKRLAIVSGQTDALAARLMDPEFVRATGGGDITWSIATTVTCPPLNQSKHTHGLACATSCSLPTGICCSARQIGQKAIDMGAVDSAILFHAATIRSSNAAFASASVG